MAFVSEKKERPEHDGLKSNTDKLMGFMGLTQIMMSSVWGMTTVLASEMMT